MNKGKKKLWIFSSLGVLTAGLCCFAPIILVLFGFASVSVAASYADIFYGSYKWVFRSAGLLFLIAGLWFYFREQGICSLDMAKKNRNHIINTTILVFIIAIVGYMVWLYGIVEIIGKWIGIW